MENTTTNVAAELVESPVVTPKINNRTVRFSDADWYKPGIPVIIGGAGGIGSWLSFALSRQECDIHLFDHDIIEEVNMAGQMFETANLNQNKAQAMALTINNFSAINIATYGEYTQDSFSSEYVFAAFDSMKARKLMYEKWLEYNATHDRKCILIDGRLSAEEIQIFAVTRKTAERYKEYLWDDSEIPDLPCSFKSTTHCSMIIAGLMTSIFNNFLTNIVFKTTVREVPFKTTMELPTLTFNTRENESTN